MKATITTRAQDRTPGVRLGLAGVSPKTAGKAGATATKTGKSRGLLQGAKSRIASARAPRLHHDHTYGDELRSRVGAGVLGLALLSGPVTLGLVLTGTAGAREVPVAAPTRAQADAVTATAQAAGAYAADFVVTWLGATRDNPDALAGFIAPPNALPAKGASVSNVQVVSTRQAGAGVWSVLVAGTVTSPGSTPARRYFQVPVLDDPAQPGSMRIAAPPAPVAGLTQGDTALAMDYSRTVTNDDVSSSVQGFLNALLTGREDITRYTSPGVSIAAISPAPYRTVRLDNLQSVEAIPDQVPADGTRAQVWVQASGIDATGSSTSLAYPLTLTARDGRWDITSLDPAPANSRGSQTPDGTRPSASAGASVPGSSSGGVQ